MDSNDIEEELICSLAVKGEKSVHKLLLNVLAIVKYLKTLQSDPVLVYQMSTKQQQDFQTNQLQSLSQQTTTPATTSTTSSTTTPSHSTSSTSVAASSSPSTTTTATNKSQTVDSSAPSNSNSPSNVNTQSLNLNTSIFINDNEKIKELNQNCLTSVVALQTIIKDILNLENKINQRDNINNDNSSSNNININNNSNQKALIEELENLKYEAYQKNCTIKKLIDNMRLLQLSINSMNRTSLSD